RRKRFGTEVLAYPPIEVWRAKDPRPAGGMGGGGGGGPADPQKGPGGAGVRGGGGPPPRGAGRAGGGAPPRGGPGAGGCGSARGGARGTGEGPAGRPGWWALVEFVHFRESDFASPTKPAPATLPGHYLVFVLRAGEPTPRMLDLGPAAGLEASAVAWCESLA